MPLQPMNIFFLFHMPPGQATFWKPFRENIVRLSNKNYALFHKIRVFLRFVAFPRFLKRYASLQAARVSIITSKLSSHAGLHSVHGGNHLSRERKAELEKARAHL